MVSWIEFSDNGLRGLRRRGGGLGGGRRGQIGKFRSMGPQGWGPDGQVHSSTSMSRVVRSNRLTTRNVTSVRFLKQGES